MSSKVYHQFACSSMLLPEHRELLNRLQRESRRQEEIRLPDFDQQQQEEWQQLLERSWRENRPLRVTYLNGTGCITRRGPALPPLSHPPRLRLKTEQGPVTIPAGLVIALELD